MTSSSDSALAPQEVQHGVSEASGGGPLEAAKEILRLLHEKLAAEDARYMDRWQSVSASIDAGYEARTRAGELGLRDDWQRARDDAYNQIFADRAETLRPLRREIERLGRAVFDATPVTVPYIILKTPWAPVGSAT